MKLYDESGNPAMVVKSASHDVASALEKVLGFYGIEDRPAAAVILGDPDPIVRSLSLPEASVKSLSNG